MLRVLGFLFGVGLIAGGGSAGAWVPDATAAYVVATTWGVLGGFIIYMSIWGGE